MPAEGDGKQGRAEQGRRQGPPPPEPWPGAWLPRPLGQVCLEGTQAGIGSQGNGRRRQGPGQQQGVVHRGDAPEDEYPQPTGTNRRADRGHPHGDHGSHPQARHQAGQGQRQLHVAQHLAATEPQGLPGLLQPGRNLLEPGEQSAQ